MKTAKPNKHPSALFLASCGEFQKIDWENLTIKHIEESDINGYTLLHHTALAGLWNKVPQDLKVKQHWRPTLDGTTIYMCAVQSHQPHWVSKENITEEELLRKNKAGDSILSLAIISGELSLDDLRGHFPYDEKWDPVTDIGGDRLSRLNKAYFTENILKSTFKNNDKYIHLVTNEPHSENIIDFDLLTENLLSIPGERGLSPYHLLAKNNKLNSLPIHLITRKGLLLEDQNGVTPLQILLAKEDPTIMLPKSLLTKDIFFNQNEIQEAPIHAWANGKYWMLIPLEFITKETLKSKGKESLFESLIYQYSRDAVWYTKTDVLLKAMTKLVKKSLRLSNKTELLENSKDLESLEKGDAYPNGIKKASTLIKEELTKRSILKELSNSEKEIEL